LLGVVSLGTLRAIDGEEKALAQPLDGTQVCALVGAVVHP